MNSQNNPQYRNDITHACQFQLIVDYSESSQRSKIEIDVTKFK